MIHVMGLIQNLFGENPLERNKPLKGEQMDQTLM